MKSINSIRCPICYLIPKIFKSQYNEYLEPSFIFTILCPNNHIKRIYNETLQTEIKFSLNDIPCKNCNLKNKPQYYCKKCYSILCEICKENHILNLNHKDIIIINEIDNICLIHNKNYYAYCNTCEIVVCKECIKLKEHKGHEINELKTLGINKIKTDIIKYKKNFKKNLEKKRNSDIKNYKNNSSLYSSISEIEQKYKIITNHIYSYINFIIDLINNYELYFEYYNIPNYNLYLNLNLIYKNINNSNIIYCKNYKNYLNIIYNYKYYDTYIFKKVYEEGKKLYCGLYKDENNDLIYVYYNVDNKKLYFFNIETWTYKKEIKLEINEEIDIHWGFWPYPYCELKFFKYKYIELFLIYLENKNTISIYDITDNNNYKKIFFKETGSDKGKVYIDYINNKILIIFLNSFEIYIFNIHNQLEIKLTTKGINLQSILFFKMKNLGKMLFISDDNEGKIYNLKSFKIYKIIEIRKIKKVIIGNIHYKECLVISCGSEGYIIYVIDFFSHEKIYRYELSTTGYGNDMNQMFLMNYKLFISYSRDDMGFSCDKYSINLITDEQNGQDYTFDKELYRISDKVYIYKLKKIKLKNFGECILGLPEDLHLKTNIVLFYFNKNANKNINENIKKINKLEGQICTIKGNFTKFEERIKIFKDRIYYIKNKNKDLIYIVELLKKFKNNLIFKNKVEELEIFKDEIYKQKNINSKIFEAKLEEFEKSIKYAEIIEPIFLGNLEKIEQIIKNEKTKSSNTIEKIENESEFDRCFHELKIIGEILKEEEEVKKDEEIDCIEFPDLFN